MNYKTPALGRRTFLKQASVVGLTLPAFQILALSGCAQQAKSGTQDSVAALSTPSGVSWKAVVVSGKEPGEPLIVSGTVYAPDGITPVEGIALHIHQTDATGHYSTSGGENRNTRINGWMRTNAEGRYEFRTIKPASYPGRRFPAHIHVYLSGPSYPEYWTDDFLFDDDPLVTTQERQRVPATGKFSHILKLERDSEGILRGRRDFKLERCSRNCTGR